jgi:hypothetical protein
MLDIIISWKAQYNQSEINTSLCLKKANACASSSVLPLLFYLQFCTSLHFSVSAKNAETTEEKQ